ncbi:MAG: LysM peptidoglycan-binding domain-containing protein [Acidobacterium ailaaui]|nr:LysM peptidoglycan-binding domain-containing protein [Pseudacidobacterium ailaaui]
MFMRQSSGTSGADTSQLDTTYGMSAGGVMFVPTTEITYDFGSGNNFAQGGTVTTTTTTTVTSAPPVQTSTGAGAAQPSPPPPTTATAPPPATSAPPAQTSTNHPATSSTTTSSKTSSTTTSSKTSSTTTSSKTSSTTTSSKTSSTSSANRYTPKASTYTVQKGDTLWGIVSKEYGIPNSGQTNYTKIANILQKVEKANPQIKNPNLIYPGQKVTLPAVSL